MGVRKARLSARCLTLFKHPMRPQPAQGAPRSVLTCSSPGCSLRESVHKPHCRLRCSELLLPELPLCSATDCWPPSRLCASTACTSANCSSSMPPLRPASACCSCRRTRAAARLPASPAAAGCVGTEVLLLPLLLGAGLYPNAAPVGLQATPALRSAAAAPHAAAVPCLPLRRRPLPQQAAPAGPAAEPSWQRSGEGHAPPPPQQQMLWHGRQRRWQALVQRH